MGRGCEESLGLELPHGMLAVFVVEEWKCVKNLGGGKWMCVVYRKLDGEEKELVFWVSEGGDISYGGQEILRELEELEF